MSKGNSIIQQPLKPLNEYLNEIHKRNKNMTHISPAIQQLYTNITTYDDLYQKLIEETYYIYNELQIKTYNNMKAKKESNTNNQRPMSFNVPIDQINDPVKKTLAFKSDRSKGDKSLKSNEQINDFLSPIPQGTKNKSPFYLTSNPKSKQNTARNNQQQNTFIGDDLTFLINNSKEIENLLETSIRQQQQGQIPDNTSNNNNKSGIWINNNNPLSQDIILKYEKVIFELEKEKNNLLEQRQQIEKELNDIKRLFSQFELKYIMISDMDINNQLQQEKNQIIVLDAQSSKKINDLFSQNLLKESNDLWKTFNYFPLHNVSLERSYEILSLLSKLKDRELKGFYQRYSIESEGEVKKKNKEIIELLANIELYRNKATDNEKRLIDLKNKLSLLIDDNSILFQENRKLKTLIEINSTLNYN